MKLNNETIVAEWFERTVFVDGQEYTCDAAMEVWLRKGLDPAQFTEDTAKSIYTSWYSI